MPLKLRYALELYHAYRHSFEATHDDAARLLVQAAALPPGRFAAAFGGSALWLYGFEEASRLEMRLLAGLARDPGLSLRVWVPRTAVEEPRCVRELEQLGFEPLAAAGAYAPRLPPELRAISAPSDEAELRRCLKLALSLDTPSAVRYPRDNVPTANFETVIAEDLREAASQDWQVGKSRVLREGTEATIVSYGALTQQAMVAAEELAAEGLSVGLVDARFCKPVDGEMLARVLRSGAAVLTLEDHTLQNGFGSAVLEYAVAHGLPTERITRLGMPDRLVAHATRKEQLAEVGLDAAGIARSVRDAVRAGTGAGVVGQAVGGIR
jgi:1-deoxy-D-xylulose-5-phosphate synthase